MAKVKEPAELPPGTTKITSTRVVVDNDTDAAPHDLFPDQIPPPERIQIARIDPPDGTLGTLEASVVNKAFIRQTWGGRVYSLLPMDRNGKRIGKAVSCIVDAPVRGNNRDEDTPPDYFPAVPGAPFDPAQLAAMQQLEEARERRMRDDDERRARIAREEEERLARRREEDDRRREEQHRRDMERLKAEAEADRLKREADAAAKERQWQQQMDMAARQADAALAREQERNQAFLRLMADSQRSQTEILTAALSARSDSGTAKELVGVFKEGFTIAQSSGGDNGTHRALELAGEGLRTIQTFAGPHRQQLPADAQRRALPPNAPRPNPRGGNVAHRAAAAPVTAAT